MLAGRRRRLRAALRWQSGNFHNPLVGWMRGCAGRAVRYLRHRLHRPNVAVETAASHRAARVERLGVRLGLEKRRLAAADVAKDTDES